MSGGLDIIATKIDAITLQHSELAQRLQSSDSMTRRMLVVLRVMCVNAAKTEGDRQNCLQENIP